MTIEEREELDTLIEKEERIIEDILYKMEKKHKDWIMSAEYVTSVYHIWIHTINPNCSNLIHFSPSRGCRKSDIPMILDDPRFSKTRMFYDGIFREIVDRIDTETALYRLMYKKILDSIF